MGYNINNLIFIHLGAKELREITPIENGFMNKPRGGLWAATFLKDNEAEGARSEWEYWCIHEQFIDYTDSPWFKFQLKEDAKVLCIDNVDDLLAVDEKYLFKGKGTLLEEKLCLDYEKIAEDYDAFYLSQQAAEMMHSFYMMPDEYQDFNLWDCESLLVFNINKICVIERGVGK